MTFDEFKAACELLASYPEDREFTLEDSKLLNKISKYIQERSKSIPCPHDKLIILWHRIMPEKPKVRSWNKNTSKHRALVKKWNQIVKENNFDNEMDAMHYVAAMFISMRQSDFLMNKMTRQLTFDFIFTGDHWDNMMNGVYK